MGTTPEERLRGLLEQAAVELEGRREDVLSSTLVWPSALSPHDCAQFLLALEQRKAELGPAGWVTVEDARFPLLDKYGVGVGVDLRRIEQVARLAG